jgi:aryl-alcohol dehydrogenase-like predicted oxidoreductase
VIIMSSSTALPTRQLGKDGPHVTALGIGLMGLSAFYGTTDPDEERLKFLDHIYASGQRFWDSADIYGDSEDLIGKYVTLAWKSTYLVLPSWILTHREARGRSISVAF